MPTDTQLLEALELGSLVLPTDGVLAETLDLPGVVARRSAIASPFVNLAACARLDASCDALLDRLVAAYDERGLPAGFLLGPRSTPSDLRARLEARGFSLLTTAGGYVLDDLAHPIPAPDGLALREIGPDDTRGELDRAKAESFDMPLAVARGIDDLLFASPRGRIRAYVAEIEGETAAFAQSFYDLGRRVVVLGGGGVIPRFRGRGAFRALVARRHADALADGMLAAVIQAWSGSSAPIVAKLGFRRVADLMLLQRPAATTPA